MSDFGLGRADWGFWTSGFQKVVYINKLALFIVAAFFNSTILQFFVSAILCIFTAVYVENSDSISSLFLFYDAEGSEN